MIRLKLSSVQSAADDTKFDIVAGESLRDAVERALKDVPLGDHKPGDVFTVVHNGHIIPQETWGLTKLSPEDNVLIAPTLRGGDESNIFRTVLMIAVVVVATVINPFAGGTVAAALFTTGVTIVGALAINALIPPSVPDAGGVGGPGYSYSDSQMYAITSQSNSSRKLQTVPKVYGAHRMFPNVAANPYTELEASAVSGQFDQYFYGIYDFGLGPLNVSDIKIGDTPIETYEDAQWFLVDPNKPEVAEGPWDDNYNRDFTYFKGSSESENFAVSLDGNRNAGEAGYETIRNSAANTKGVSQSITLSLVNQRGLFGYATSGERGPRQIELEIYFAKVGTEDWHGFNDFNYVEEFLAVGGESQFEITPIEPYAPYQYDDSTFVTQSWLSLYTRIRIGPVDPPTGAKFEFSDPGYYLRTAEYGWAKGSTKVIVKNNAPITVGSVVTYNTLFVGRVASLYYPIDKAGYVEITFERPLQRNFTLIVLQESYPDPNTTKKTSIHKYFWWGIIGDSQGTAQLGIGRPQLGKAYIKGNTSEPVYSTFRFTPREIGQFKIRITRISTASSFTFQVEDSLTFNNITTRFDTSPIVTDKRHVFLEVKMRATNQLNGAISNLSAVCESILDVYDPETETWSKQPTSSPAWVFADLLTGEVNKRAIPKSRLHLPSLLEWDEFCKEIPPSPPGYDFSRVRFSTNFVLDFATTLQGILNQVANGAQASMNIIDGKYGVLIDRYRDVPVQIFTPRNSRDFGSARVYTRRPDAVKVSFVDPQSDWAVNETVVYDNGFDANSALDFDEIASFACTNEEQAWRYGRYMIAQNRLRQETITLTVDFEYLVCSRGDYVQVVQDVMKVGGNAARVKTLVGNRITIDDALDINPALEYGYTFRSKDGSIHTNTLTAVFSDTFDLDGDLPDTGDLIVIGEVGKIVYDCIVKSISPNDDLSATLTLVEKADEIYEAESTTTFTPYTPRLNQTTDPLLAPPGEVEDLVVLANTWKCAGTGYEYYVTIDWDTPPGAAPEVYEIYVDGGRGFNLVATTRESQYRYVVNTAYLGVEHRFKVLAVSATGKKLDLGAVMYVAATPLYKTERPQNVADLSIDITGEVLQLVWPQVDQCDIQEYLIRYSPALDATWEASVPLLRVNKNTTLAATQARKGIYLIKAVDFNGNQSASATKAITTIPDLFNLNVIEEVDDFPALAGGKDLVSRVGDTLTLKQKVSGAVEDIEYFPEGFYYYENLLDLGEIFTVRLQSLIQAEGIEANDIMSNWTSLAAVAALSNAGTSDWDVEAQYRSTENLNVIAEWANLAAVATISEGETEDWTPWRKFIMGDATGRIFQFRLRLISNRESVTPRVFSGVIKADMPDRTDSFDNLEAPDTGLEVIYDPPFYGPEPTPNLQVSIESAESGDYWSFDYRTLEGFKIRFFDKDGNPVARTFDAVAKGYGRKFASVI